MCGVGNEGGACAENSADEFGEAEENVAAYADPGAAFRLVIMDV